MTISDEQMLENLKLMREYAVVLLRDGPNAGAENNRPIIWEHGRRNLELREQGLLDVVMPLRDRDGGDSGDSDIEGLCIFNTTVDAARAIMSGDPAVQAGIFVFDVYPANGFPGDALRPNERAGTPPAPPAQA